jgi:hypothetical protein
MSEYGDVELEYAKVMDKRQHNIPLSDRDCAVVDDYRSFVRFRDAEAPDFEKLAKMNGGRIQEIAIRRDQERAAANDPYSRFFGQTRAIRRKRRG